MNSVASLPQNGGEINPLCASTVIPADERARKYAVRREC
jgi:hypothetical protein